MKLDLRLPIGLMFSIIGALLVVFGLVSDPAIYQRSLGINVNLWWGLVLLVFGLVMLWLVRRRSGSASSRAQRGILARRAVPRTRDDTHRWNGSRFSGGAVAGMRNLGLVRGQRGHHPSLHHQSRAQAGSRLDGPR